MVITGNKEWLSDNFSYNSPYPHTISFIALFNCYNYCAKNYIMNPSETV